MPAEFMAISERGAAIGLVVEEVLELLEHATAGVDPARLDDLQRCFDAACLAAGAVLVRPDSARADDMSSAQLARFSKRRDELEREIARKDAELAQRADALRMFRAHVDVIAEATMPAACYSKSAR